MGAKRDVEVVGGGVGWGGCFEIQIFPLLSDGMWHYNEQTGVLEYAIYAGAIEFSTGIGLSVSTARARRAKGGLITR